MILQALTQYYQRAEGLATDGWEYKRIPFYIEITQDGTFLQLIDRRSGPKAKEVTPTLVPKSEIRRGTRSFERPNLLWDHYGFVLGMPKSDSAKDVATAANQLKHFVARVSRLHEVAPSCIELKAILSFYDHEQNKRVIDDPVWPDCYGIAGCNLTFRIAGQSEIALHAEAIRKIVLANPDNEGSGETAPNMVCLVTGEISKIAKLHFPIAGVGEKPAPLCATNEAAYWSYGKEKGFGYPIGDEANFQYTTALNHLLRPGSRQRLRIGDASTVFWAQEQDEIEDSFASIFGESDDPDHTEALRAVLESIHAGKFDGARGDKRFFVLGLAPNAARISVRFWQAEPLRDIARHICAWFDDLEIARGNNDPQYLSLKRLLACTCLATKDKPFGDIERLPPAIGGDTSRAILSGGELPITLLGGVLQRCRAEQAKKDEKSGRPVRNVSYPRVALIKACLNRYARINKQSNKEITVSLDKSNDNNPYLLGRLFAVFERMQEYSVERELNRSIRDSFFGAAMATPRSVFPRLVRLNAVHFRDIKRSRADTAAYFDRLLQEINNKLDPKTAFPSTLSLRDQGAFTIGYYHQRPDLLSQNN